MTEGVAERRTRGRWSVRRLHKWMSVTVGICIFAWVASGLVIIAPVGNRGRQAQPPIEFESLTVSPAQAAAVALGAQPGSEVTAVTLRRLGGDMVYLVSLRGAAPRLVDARNAHLLTVTQELAVRLVLQGLPEGATVSRVERVDGRQFAYFGPLPAYRVEIADEAGTRGIVAVATGEMQLSDRKGRLRLFLGSFHEFFPLEFLPGGERARPVLLWATSLVALAVALTGYWLSLPPRQRQRS